MATDEEGKQPPDPATLRVFQANLDDEIDGIALYGLLAEAERDTGRKSIFTQLAAVEERHANIWREKLREAGVQPREHGPSLRVRIIGFLARRFGVRPLLPLIRGMEAGAHSLHMAQG